MKEYSIQTIMQMLYNMNSRAERQKFLKGFKKDIRKKLKKLFLGYKNDPLIPSGEDENEKNDGTQFRSNT